FHEEWKPCRLPDMVRLSAARRRAVDRLRREQVGARKLAALALIDPPESGEPVPDNSIPDDRLRLLFTCCHPALAFEAQVALALRTLTGLTTAEIARAFGVPEATMAKRLARAKQKIRDAGIPYRVPPDHLLPERTRAVLGVLYLLFNEGYVASGGPRLQRPELAAEARRLAALVVELMPDDPEAGRLHALVLLQQARVATRAAADGTLIPLEEQDRARWDRALIGAGLLELRRTARRDRLGPYQLQAMIAACHVTAESAAATDWARIVELYDALIVQVPSPTVVLNRAIAVAMRSGPAAGLTLLAESHDAGPLPARLLAATRADLHRRLGENDSAAIEYRRALELTTNDAERAYLRRRLAEVET
ncbi:RNA polymerase sigma factor, partial [Nocardia sp. NPDC004722]